MTVSSCLETCKLNGIGGFPHSEICGSKVAHTSPQLIAACHVLHRLYAPRHPRIALTSRLRVRTTNDNAGTDHARKLAWPDQNSAEQQSHSILVRMIKNAQPDNYRCRSDDQRIRRANPSSSLAKPTPYFTASILRTHSQCQIGGANPACSRRSGRVFSSSLDIDRARSCQQRRMARLNTNWWSLSGSNR